MMRQVTISCPRWTRQCSVWLFCGLIQLVPPIDWYAFALICVIMLYEAGIWSGGANYSFYGYADNGNG